VVDDVETIEADAFELELQSKDIEYIRVDLWPKQRTGPRIFPRSNLGLALGLMASKKFSNT
jgi:hypothetical protein